MINITNIETYGWKTAIHGMRNPMNSWDKSDSAILMGESGDRILGIGERDLKLMMDLSKAGHDHAKYRRMIMVSMDILAPLYWWKEFDTYKVGTVANSCSTMHKIHAKEFTLNDFSYDYLSDAHAVSYASNIKYEPHFKHALECIIDMLNTARTLYLETKDKDYWYTMIQLLPTSYNQFRTVTLNYEVLANIYPSRKNHKLDEWYEFCKMIENLPYSQIIIGEELL